MGLRVLAGQGAPIDTTAEAGRLVFGIFGALVESERELIRERTPPGSRPRGRSSRGGRFPVLGGITQTCNFALTVPADSLRALA